MKTFWQVLALLFGVLSQALSAPGSLDTTFSFDGVTTVAFPGASTLEQAFAATVQPDGRIVIVGKADNDFALLRLNADGTPDMAFGVGGKVAKEFFGSVDEAYAVAIQTDGKVVVAGRISSGGTGKMGVARFLGNGELDESFASNGVFTTTFEATGSVLNDARDIAIQSDGKIVVAGRASNNATGVDYGVIRLTTAGALDSGFGAGGKTTFDFPGGSTFDEAQSVLLQADGKILVAGMTEFGSWTMSAGVARLESNGAMDMAFGTNGLVTLDVGTRGMYGYDVALQSNGKIIVGGRIYGTGIDGISGGFALARLTTAGALDPAFGTSGTTGRVFTSSVDNSGRQLIVRADDSILLTGSVQKSASDWDYAVMSFDADGQNPAAFSYSESFSVATREESFGAVAESGGRIVLVGMSALNDSNDFGFVRLTTGLGLDTGWSTDGIGSTTFGSGARARAAVQQPDGNVILAGRIWDGTRMKGLVARYDTRGSLDTSFNGGGTSIFVGASGDDEVAAAALQADGKVVVAGSHAPGGDSQFAVWRLGTTGLLDSAFGSSGGAAFGFGFTDERANAVLVQGDGKIVMAGRANGEFALVRVLSDGSLDSGFGSAGKAQTNFAAGASEANGAALDASGRIVVAGFAGGDVAVARFDASGVLDTSFGSGGKVTLDLFGGSTDAASAVLVLPDGDLMLACTSGGDFAALRLNADGSVDTAFGTAGVARVDVGAADTCHAIARRSDGSLFLSGESAGKFACVALQSNGSLLTSFAGGSLTTDLQAGTDAARAVIVQSDGRVLLAGLTTDGSGVEMLGSCRYNVNGTLDQTFGGAGPGPMIQAGQWPVPVQSTAYSVVAQPDGRVVTAGSCGDSSRPNGFDFALSRHLADGTLDAGFGSGGMVVGHVAGLHDVCKDVTLQPDGKIIAAGQSGTFSGGGGVSATLVRYDAAGVPDSSFGTSGVVTVSAGAGASAIFNSVVVEPGGRVMAAGRIGSQPAIVRFLSTGAVDTSFGVAGVSSPLPSGWTINAVTLQTDGKVVAAGNTGTGTGANGFLVRLTSSGSADASFGSGGVVELDAGNTETMTDVIMGASGTIITVGRSYGSGVNTRLVVTRTLSNGAPDTSFDSDGLFVYVNADPLIHTAATGVRVLPDQKIVISGTWTYYQHTTYPYLVYTDFMLLALEPGGSPASGFGTGGLVVTPDTSPEETTPNGNGDNDDIYGMDLAVDGKIIVAGTSTPPRGQSFGIARYETGLACEIAVEEPASNDLVDGTASRDFGSLPVGQSVMKTFVIRNTGHVDLTGLAVTKGGTNAADAALGTLGATTLAPGASTTFTVTFTPSAAGARTASIQIASNDADENPFDIALTATGTVPEIVLEQPAGSSLTDGSANVAFGSLTPGASSALSLTVRNTGTADLTGLSLSVDGTHASDFVTGALGATTLAPGASTTFAVTFTPSAIGSRSAALHLTSNDADENPFDVALSGTGVLPSPGNLDLAFGSGGKVMTAIGSGDDVVRAMAVQADGKIILAGESSISGGDDFSIVRYNTDGMLDTSFGSGGKVTTAFAGSLDWARAVAIQPDGKIVAAGTSGSGNGTDDFAVARYLADGTLDTAFSGDGKHTMHLGGNDAPVGLCLPPDGRIVIAGSSYSGTSNLAIVRLNADGTPDTTFSGDGILVTSFGGNDNAGTVALQADGKIVIGGYSFLGSPTNGKILLTRINPDGTLDSSFGTSGKVNTDTGFNTPMYALVIRPDGRILIGGGRLNGTNWDFLLASYTSAGAVDTSFGTSGLKVTSLGGNETVAGLARQPNGKIVAIGTSNAAGTNDFALVRYFDDGTTDTSFGVSGTAMVPVGTGSDLGVCVAMQSDGNILAAGYAHNGSNYDFALARLFGDPLAPEITVEQPPGTPLTDAVSTISFAGTKVGTPSAKVVTVRNDGTAILSALAVSVDGTASADFVAGALGSSTLAPGASTTFSLTFTPLANGSRTAAIHITSNDADENPFDITVQGTGTLPEIDVEQPAGSPLVDGTSTVTFGSTRTGAGVTRTFALSNTGTAALEGISLTINGSHGAEFVVTTPPPAILAAGSSTTFTLTFTPTGNATRTAALHIASNDADENPFDISLTGIGIAPGFMDQSFGTSGKVTTAIGTGDDIARGLVVQPDGKIIVVGESNIGGGDDFSLARYNSDGTLDTSFGAGGKVTTPFAGSLDWGRAAAIQPDGKIVVAGHAGSGNGTDDFAAARYQQNGTLDTTFSGDGKQSVNLGGNDTVAGLCLQPDGRIVIAGSSYSGTSNVGLVRLNADGSLDTTFSGDGMLLTTFGGNDNASAVALQPDGRIVIAGYSFLGSPTNGKILVARFNADGTLHSGFGTGGKVNTDTGFNTPIYALLIRPDGRIVIGGGRLNGSDWDFLIAAYTAAGVLDTTFGTSGLKVTSLGGSETIASMVLQPNGRIVALGTSNASGTNDFAFARYLGDGTLDASFGTGGTTLLPIGTGADIGSGVTLQGDGSILAAGYSHNGSNYDFALTRLVGDLYSGAGLNQQTWRFTHFGTTDGSGNAADLADPEQDGQSNLLEFATGTSPSQSTPATQSIQLPPGSVIFTYQRSRAALLDGIQFTVQHNDSLDTNNCSISGVTETVISDNGILQTVQATLPASASSRRFARLQVQR